MAFHNDVPYDSHTKPTNTSYVVILEFDGDPGGNYLYAVLQEALKSTIDRYTLTGIRVAKK